MFIHKDKRKKGDKQDGGAELDGELTMQVFQDMSAGRLKTGEKWGRGGNFCVEVSVFQILFFIFGAETGPRAFRGLDIAADIPGICLHMPR